MNKRLQLSNLIIAFAAISIATSAAASSTPEKSENSFYNLALATTPNIINSKVNVACISAIKSLNGRPVHSKIITQYLVRIADVPYQQVSDGIFFHYTNSEPAFENAKAGNLDKNFSYIRNTSSKEPFLYVASDPDSSRHFGDLQIQIQISPEEKIFFPQAPDDYQKLSKSRDPNLLKITGGIFGANLSARLNINQKIESEIIENYPELAPCAGIQLGEMRVSTFLLTLALEAEHVPLIAYFGTSVGWFQVLGEWAIQSVSTRTDLQPLNEKQAKQRSRIKFLHPTKAR